MKPIIIIKEKNANGKFEFTEQELKDLIEQVYAAGVADEKKNHNLNWITTTPGTIPRTMPDRGTATPAFPPNDNIVYCGMSSQTNRELNSEIN